MIILDAYIPEGVFSEQAENELLRSIQNDIFTVSSFFNNGPADDIWNLLHRPTAILVEGEPSQKPHFRFVIHDVIDDVDTDKMSEEEHASHAEKIRQNVRFQGRHIDPPIEISDSQVQVSFIDAVSTNRPPTLL